MHEDAILPDPVPQVTEMFAMLFQVGLAGATDVNSSRRFFKFRVQVLRNRIIK